MPKLFFEPSLRAKNATQAGFEIWIAQAAVHFSNPAFLIGVAVRPGRSLLPGGTYVAIAQIPHNSREMTGEIVYD